MSTIDTLNFSEELIAAGLDEKVSKTLASKLKEALDSQKDNAATKQDIAHLEEKNENAATKHDIELVKQDIINLEYRLTLKFGLIVTAAIAIVTWLDKIIF